MRNLYGLIWGLSLLISISGYAPLVAQPTQGFTYQAIARDLAGAPLATQSINLRFQIRSGSGAGPLVYQERHTPSSDAFGLVTALIGAGQVEVGDFSTLDWAAAPLVLLVELNGSPADTMAFQAVPYAKMATDMDLRHLRDVDPTPPLSQQILKWNGSAWAPATDDVNDADASPSNEIQTLSLSGSTLSLSQGGGSVSLPTGTTYTAGDGITISAGNAIAATLGTSIQTGEIDNAAVTEAKLANNAVSTAKIANAAVTAAKLNQSGAANGQILKWNGTAWAPATDNVNDADASTSNEIQTLSLSGNNLTLSLGGGSVALPTGTPSQWTTAGSNIHYNSGNVGIGDATPAATLTVGNGDKFQVSGTDGDVRFVDPQASIQFPAVSAAAPPMMYMFANGTANADRMVIGHSPSFSTWGLEYKDTADVFFLRNGGARQIAFNLNSGRIGIGLGDELPGFPIDLAGRMRLRSTGSLGNSPGIWFNNNANTFSRAFIGMAEPDSIIGIFSQHMNKWAVEFEVMREPRIGVNVPAGSPPRAEIHVYHTNFGGSNDGIRIQNEGSNNHYWNLYTSNSTGNFEFYKQGIRRATIDLTSGAYTAVSDARLKTEVSLLAPVLPQVMQLEAKTYRYLDQADARRYTGFLAQELQTRFPEFVYFGGDDQQTYTVDYAGLSVIALKAIQEQQALIEALRAELAALRQQVEALQAGGTD